MNAVTFSSYINAYTLYVASRKLGIEFQTTDLSATFPIPHADESMSFDWLIFSEEASLGAALRGELKGKFLPEFFPLKLLDDKWLFAEWLKSQPDLTLGLSQYSINEEIPCDFPFYIKAKHSWLNSFKLPRGWVCRSTLDISRFRLEIEKLGVSDGHFFVQEWLGDDLCRVISVCGFYDVNDSNRNLCCVVERVAAYNDGPSCSAMVATIEDKWNLSDKASNILKALDFIGPYELEFLVTPDRVVVLELNPRFWMQHALFLADGNGLLKRYYGLDTLDDRKQKTIRRLLWIDGLYLVKGFLFFRLEIFKLIFNKSRAEQYELLIWPSVPMAVLVLIRLICQKLARAPKTLRALQKK